MSDDFGTINVRRGDRTREIEILRQHYKEHRDTLNRLAAEAPSEHLAAEYGRLVHDIHASLAKLDEIEGRTPAGGAAAGAAALATAGQRPERARAEASRTVSDPLLRAETEPGTRPFAPHPARDREEGVAADDGEMHDDSVSRSSGWRLPVIVVVMLLVLGGLGWAIWRASSDRRSDAPPIVETVAPVTAAPDTGTIAPAAPPPQRAAAAGGLSIEPASADYGVIRKGTRAARQFEVVNNTGAPVQIQLARSQCRCLFYEYNSNIKPNAKETVTVTVDAARVKNGSVQETVTVSSKKTPSVKATFDVAATVQ